VGSNPSPSACTLVHYRSPSHSLANHFGWIGRASRRDDFRTLAAPKNAPILPPGFPWALAPARSARRSLAGNDPAQSFGCCPATHKRPTRGRLASFSGELIGAASDSAASGCAGSACDTSTVSSVGATADSTPLLSRGCNGLAPTTHCVPCLVTGHFTLLADAGESDCLNAGEGVVPAT
jgi:hypothetical protein